MYILLRSLANKVGLCGNATCISGFGHNAWVACPVAFAVFGVFVAVLTSASQAAAERLISVSVQSRDVQGNAIKKVISVDPGKTAIIVIDMWNRHWCKTFTARAESLIPQMNRTTEACRKLGIQVVFAPAEVADFYKDTPQRKSMQAIAQHPKPQRVVFNPPNPPGPIDNCECGPSRPCPVAYVWKRQNADLEIADNDLIGNCTDERELLNLCQERGIDTLLYAGVASNMCVLNRPFGILNMKRYGLRAVVIGDLVKAITANGIGPDGKADAAFTPDKGSGLVLRHIEQYIAPSISSRQLIQAAYPTRSSSAKTDVKHTGKDD